MMATENHTKRFVTPLRVTPHRKLASSPPSEAGGEKGGLGGTRYFLSADLLHLVLSLFDDVHFW